MPTLTEIVRDMVFNSGVPAKSIAQELRKSYTTFLRELNPDDDGAKLGADALKIIMEKCKEVTPLRHLAMQLGYRLMPLTGVTPDKATLSEEVNDDVQVLAPLQAALLDVQNTTLEDAEALAMRMHLEIDENLVAFRQEKLSLMKKAG